MEAPRLFSIDSRSLAAFRIAIGLLLLGDLAIRAMSIEAHYSDLGVVPLQSIVDRYEGTWRWSIHLLHGSAAFQTALMATAALSAFLLLIGYQTRLATIVSWALLASLQVRNPLILNGGDLLLRLMLFWAMFLPLGCRWSVDRYRGAQIGRSQVRSLASFAILMQICVMYFMTGYFKVAGDWLSGQELSLIMHYDAYAKPLAYVLQGYPTLLQVSGILVVILELVGPFLLLITPSWWRLRTGVVIAFVLLHVGIELTLTVGLFAFVCWTGLILFLPREFWDRVLRRPIATSESPAVDPPTALATRSPVLRWATRVFLTVAMTFVLYWNLLPVEQLGARMPAHESIRRFGEVTHLLQDWRLFDRAPTRDGWYVLILELRSDEAVDLLRDGAPADDQSFTKPRYVYRQFPDHRWRKLFRNLLKDSNVDYRDSTCRYFARRWNLEQTDERAAEVVDLQYMEEVNDRSDEELYMQRQFEFIDLNKPESTQGDSA